MNVSFETFIEPIILVTALSLDAFAAAFAYGVSSIRIPWLSVIVLAGISSLALALSSSLGIFISGHIPQQYIKIICFIMLLLTGCIKLCDSFIKSIIRKKQGLNSELHFTVFKLNFILCIYASPDIADLDRSKILSIKEAIPVSIALSLDSLAVGIGAALDTFYFWYAIPASFILGLLAIITGSGLGRKTLISTKGDFTWVSGLMLIGLAVLKLF